MTKILSLASVFVLCGCWGTQPVKLPPIDTTCVGCATVDSVQLKLAVQPPLDLSEYKGIGWIVDEKAKTATITYDDLLKLNSLETLLEGRIIVLQKDLDQYRNFYEKPKPIVAAPPE